MIFIRIFSGSVLLWEVVPVRLSEVFVDLFQGETLKPIEPTELNQYRIVWLEALEVVLFEFEELVRPLEVHEHFFDKAIIDLIVSREIMAV